MAITPNVFFAKVMHRRLFPKVNQFTYKVYYLFLPLSKLFNSSLLLNLSVNKQSALSFHESDHGAKDGSKNETWIRNILIHYGYNDIVDDIILISMPRILGYVFNPVSFWLCCDSNGLPRAVLCEVNNTFGETHSYLCAHKDKSPIKNDDWLEGQKLFYVSPFLEREGSYKFRFALQDTNLGIWIDYYNKEGKKQLLTSLTGKLAPITRKTLRHAFWTHPLITVRTIFLIHWQALKLVLKGIKHVKKPKQLATKLTSTDNINTM